MKATLKYSPWDFLLTCLGLLFLLVDIILDTWAVMTFYQEEAYICLGLLLLLLLGSSVLVQIYSWLWYGYDDYNMKTRVEKCLNLPMLKLLHMFQLGIYLRHAGVFEVSIRSFRSHDPEVMAIFLTHDLSMLRLIETFSESAPQLVLMLTVILARGELSLVTGLKAFGSASAIACSVTMYHRSLRSFLPDKVPQKICSSGVYFLWNLLLIIPRLIALSLFASIWPCFIFTHFGCSWLVLFFFAWRAKTTFMDSSGGEWLFRATIGLIWYFNWLNVAEGDTMYRSLLYHSYILADICLLCNLWCWKIYTEPHYLEIPFLYAIITSACVVVVYILGLLLKLIYYKFFHPKKLAADELNRSEPEASPTRLVFSASADTVDSPQMEDIEADGAYRSMPVPTEPVQKQDNTRMRKLAENFYC
ncbi:hypothetical protein LDENG_00289400 [Lucifuga dentata]|nr:hypothetical protein LDENG_00289400 [Lucifuga dentata]